MELIGQFSAIAGVLVLLLATLWWLRRRGFVQVAAFKQLTVRRSNTRRMERLERLALSPQHTLHLVRLGDTTLVVAASPAGCSLIQTLPSATIGCASAREDAQ